MKQEILAKQYELQKRFGNDLLTMSIEERVAFIKEHVVYMNNEVAEMLEELPYFKPWKDYSKMTTPEKALAMQKARKEYVDVLHLVANIGVALHLTEDEIMKMYLDKNKENIRRQDEGYDHTMRHVNE